MLNQVQKEAILWEHKILNDIEVYKETRKPENITLDKFINEVWIPHQENSKNLRHTTLAFNSYILKIVLQYFNDVKLCDVSSQHIEKYIHYLRNGGLWWAGLGRITGTGWAASQRPERQRGGAGWVVSGF